MALTQTPEEGLKVSNAPSDGKFLQYKDSTDKLTWATVSTSDSTKMPLAGGTFTGDVIFDGDSANITFDKSTDDLKFDDNAQAIFGAGSDLFLYSNGTHGFVGCQHSGGSLNLGTTSSNGQMTFSSSGVRIATDLTIDNITDVILTTGSKITIEPHPTTDTDGIRFKERSANGSAYIGLKGVLDKGSDASYTITLPSAAPTANGQALTATTAGVASWNTISSQDTLSFRNLIINGAMQIAQRGTSSTSNGYKTVDRFSHYAGQGTTTWSQTSDPATSGIATHGCRYALRCTNTSGSTAANAYREITYKIENQDLMQSGWDYTSASSKLTLSFWVRASVAQTYYGRIRWMGDSADKNFVFSTGSLSANTWTRVTVSIPGLSGKTLNDGNSSNPWDSIWQINWAPFQGTDGTASDTALNTWNAYSGSSKYPDYATTWAGTNGATFDITGIQLEVGDTATDFEHRTYADQITRCQRYYYKKPMFYGACMSYTPGSGDHQYRRYGTDHPVEMRAAPSYVGGDFAIWSWSSATGISASNITFSGDHGKYHSSLSVTCTAANGPAPANGPGSGHMLPCRQLDSEFDAEI